MFIGHRLCSHFPVKVSLLFFPVSFLHLNSKVTLGKCNRLFTRGAILSYQVTGIASKNKISNFFSRTFGYRYRFVDLNKTIKWVFSFCGEANICHDSFRQKEAITDEVYGWISKLHSQARVWLRMLLANGYG